MPRPGEKHPESGEIVKPKTYLAFKHPRTGKNLLRDMETGKCFSATGTPFQDLPVLDTSPKKADSKGSHSPKAAVTGTK